jgi:hypothetical protein
LSAHQSADGMLNYKQDGHPNSHAVAPKNVLRNQVVSTLV